MASDDILRMILEMLRRLESRLNQQEEAVRLASSQGRPTEQFPKIELEIRKIVDAHAERCAAAWKEKMGALIDPLSIRVKSVEDRVSEVKKDLGGKINGVKEDAAKTATGSVTTLSEKVDFLGRDVAAIQGILDGKDSEPGLGDMVRELGKWIEDEEIRRDAARERSRFNITTWLTIIGILTGIGLGIWGILAK